MSEKIIRYISWGLGSLAALGILLINDGFFAMHGLFASSIKYTWSYEVLRDIVPRSWAYFLWYILLGGGIYLSWKLRFKTASFVKRVIKAIHEKA